MGEKFMLSPDSYRDRSEPGLPPRSKSLSVPMLREKDFFLYLNLKISVIDGYIDPPLILRGGAEGGGVWGINFLSLQKVN
ncbi:hypothetical protein [Ulvibacter antarcticus]|uniref:hypothetical protein n=1 Tax=Ulvibacter antarcticus TaxID=442714 RepID=UPI000EF97970|nr:hypothetical protein [Ulvibacter antarcticus]